MFKKKSFTIQNVSIKLLNEKEWNEFYQDLQYKMFLLNTRPVAESVLEATFTIQNVSIKSIVL